MTVVSGLLVRPGVKRKAEAALVEDGRVLVLTATSSGKETRVELSNIEAVFVLPGGIHLHLHSAVKMWGVGKGVVGVQMAVSGAAALHQRGATLNDVCGERSLQLGLLVDAMVSRGYVAEQQVLRNVDLEFEGVGPKKDLCSHGAMGGYLFQLEQTPFMVTKSTDISCLVSERLKINASDSLDLVVVMKDLQTTYFIPGVQKKHATRLDAWASTRGVETYWSNVNLKWKSLLLAIAEDMETFREEGWRCVLETDAPLPPRPSSSPSQQQSSRFAADRSEASASGVAATAPAQLRWFGMTAEQVMRGEGEEDDEDYLPGVEAESDDDGDEDDDNDDEDDDDDSECATGEGDGQSGWEAAGMPSPWDVSGRDLSIAPLPTDPHLRWFGLTKEEIVNSEKDEDEDYVPQAGLRTLSDGEDDSEEGTRANQGDDEHAPSSSQASSSGPLLHWYGRTKEQILAGVGDSDDEDFVCEEIVVQKSGNDSVGALAERLQSTVALSAKAPPGTPSQTGPAALRWFGMTAEEILAGNSDDDVDYVYESEEDEFSSAGSEEKCEEEWEETEEQN